MNDPVLVAVVICPQEISFERWSTEAQDVVTDVVSCPDCAAFRDLTLVADGDRGHIRCPLGHESTHPYINASRVRQIWHSYRIGQPVALSDARKDRPLMTIPALDEDLALQPHPSEAALLRQQPRWGWEVDAWASQNLPPLVHAMRLARHLANWAMLDRGDLWQAWYPDAGGSALEAHMTTVVLALALYESAYQIGETRVDLMTLGELRGVLGTDTIVQPTLRPVGQRHEGGRLRLTDVARIEAASTQDWTRWRLTAQSVVTAVIEDAARPDRDAADTTFALQAPQYWPDDMTWYQGDFDADTAELVSGPEE